MREHQKGENQFCVLDTSEKDDGGPGSKPHWKLPMFLLLWVGEASGRSLSRE